MGLSDLFKKPPAPTPESDISGLFAPKPVTDDTPPPVSAKLSHATMQVKEGKPYLALIGQTFDVWGVVDVVGDSRSHIAAKGVPESIFKRTGEQVTDDIVAFDRKLVLAHTKGFHELPREEAYGLITVLGDNLMSYVDDMKERLESAARDCDDSKWLREELRDTEKEFKEMWAEDLSKFRSEELPQAVVDYWQGQVEEHRWEMERAEQSLQRALDKLTFSASKIK